MTRAAAIVALALGTLAAAYTKGRLDGRALMTIEIAEAREASREATAKLEAQRLAAMADRNRLATALEDEAREAPVTHPVCLPADRVRRLDRLR